MRCALGLAVVLLAACDPRDGGIEDGDSSLVPPALASDASPTAHSGPVVLVTFTSLRADAIGYLGGPLGTRHFDHLADRAEFAGSAVAASSSLPVSAASLVLGVDPFKHGLLDHLSNNLRADLPTLGSALGQKGYHSTIHYSVPQRLHSWGFFQGFDAATNLDPKRRSITEQLRNLDGSQQFLWIHLPTTELPWSGSPGLDLEDLYPYSDPARTLPEDLRNRARRLYLEAVHRADDDLGRILQALEDSGHRNETLLAVTALHGLELGEHRQVLSALNLGRESIQVPLLIDLPAAWSTRALHATGTAADQDPQAARRPPVAATRLWSTLVKVTGGASLPIHAPSLFEADPSPALSSLYLGNGINQHSAVFPASGGDGESGGDGLEQILIESRFADSEPEFYPALLALASMPAPGLSESPRRLFERLRREFIHGMPWSTYDATGASTISWRLERWRRIRGVDVVRNEAAARRRATQAFAAWQRWIGPEETPHQSRNADVPALPAGAILSGPLGP